MHCPPWPALAFIIPSAFLGWQILFSSHLLMAQFLGNWYWQWRILGHHDERCWISEKLQNSPIFQAFWDCGEGGRKTIECNRERLVSPVGSLKLAREGRRGGKLRLWHGKGCKTSFKCDWGARQSCCSRNGVGKRHLLWFVSGKSQSVSL